MPQLASDQWKWPGAPQDGFSQEKDWNLLPMRSSEDEVVLIWSLKIGNYFVSQTDENGTWDMYMYI